MTGALVHYRPSSTRAVVDTTGIGDMLHYLSSEPANVFQQSQVALQALVAQLPYF